MADQFPAIIVLAPLFGALIVGLAGSRDHRICFPVVLVSLAVSLFASLGVFLQVLQSGPVSYFMSGWDTEKSVLGAGIELRIDAINGLVLIVIAVVSILVSIFSIRRAGEETTEKTPQFYVLFLLLTVGIFGMTVTNDAFNLFVLVEVSSLTSYALIAMGKARRGTMAAFNYILMGTVGASFYLLGVGYLYLKTGTLNMGHIHEVLTANGGEIGRSPSVMVAFVMILVGLWIKMAFFPLYGWLPNAYSYAPSTSGCILAPLMTKVSVYVMIRVMLGVFGWEWVFGHLGWNHAVVWLAVIAILAGSVLALAQRELKKMLCYLIVAEVGYMVGGAWLADSEGWGMTGAIYHILADAFMTLCLFIAASILVKRCKARRIEDLGGMFKKMPVTMTGFIIGALAMIGIPPTCGFFSKFYLIRGGIESGHWEFVAALILSSLINAVLFFRIFEIAFFGNKPAEGHGHEEGETSEQGSIGEQALSVREARLSTLIPLLVTAAIVILLGVFNGPVIAVIRSAIEPLIAVGG
ncbi:MAG: monovalent cation/H+ antiporter subunit D family protein [Verrucomicrobiales bacterium]|nr:monovalent cation/H+ antiporter subunit D family protein [Verrucomicrobiales bacterium]